METGFQTVGHGPVVGHKDISSGSQSCLEQATWRAVFRVLTFRYLRFVCVAHSAMIAKNKLYQSPVCFNYKISFDLKSILTFVPVMPVVDVRQISNKSKQ